MTPSAVGTEPGAGELAARAACHAVLTAYADWIDGGCASRVVELFTGIFLKPGDVVEVGIAGLAALRNRVAPHA